MEDVVLNPRADTKGTDAVASSGKPAASWAAIIAGAVVAVVAATHVKPKDKSDAARSTRPTLSVARALMLGLRKQAYGAMVWYINADARECEVLRARSYCATRDLVREAMISCYKLDRRE